MSFVDKELLKYDLDSIGYYGLQRPPKSGCNDWVILNIPNLKREYLEYTLSTIDKV